MLVGLLERDSRIRLHLFAGSAGAYGAGFGGQVVEHPADEPWPDLFDSIDLVVLPQARTSGGEVQSPAKLLDAMRFGVPIVTSPTEAIVEAAAETVVYVESWSDLSEVAAAINRRAATEMSWVRPRKSASTACSRLRVSPLPRGSSSGNLLVTAMSAETGKGDSEEHFEASRAGHFPAHPGCSVCGRFGLPPADDGADAGTDHRRLRHLFRCHRHLRPRRRAGWNHDRGLARSKL